MNARPCRKELLHRINVTSFAVVDTQLFLDTHPNCTEALEYFRNCSEMRNQALKEYAMYYGPLTIDTTVHSCNDYWNWINEPWPWQEGGC